MDRQENEEPSKNEMSSRSTAMYSKQYISSAVPLIWSEEESDGQDEPPNQSPSLERKLEEEDLVQVFERLRSFSTKWFSIGLVLQIPKQTLSKIEADHLGDTERQLIEMMDTWIKRGRDCYLGTLIKALTTLGYCEDLLQNARKLMELVEGERSQANRQKHQVIEYTLNALGVPCDDDASLDDITRYMTMKSARLSESQVLEVLQKTEILLQNFGIYSEDMIRWGEEAQQIQRTLHGLKQLLEAHLDNLGDDKRQLTDDNKLKAITTQINDVKSDLEKCTQTLQLISEHQEPINDGLSYCIKEIPQATAELEKINKLLKTIGTSSRHKLPEVASVFVGAVMGAVVVEAVVWALLGALLEVSLGPFLGAVVWASRVAGIGYGLGVANAIKICIICLGAVVGASVAGIGYVLGVANAIKICIIGAVLAFAKLVYTIWTLSSVQFVSDYPAQEIDIHPGTLILLIIWLIGISSGLLLIHLATVVLATLYAMCMASSRPPPAITAKTKELIEISDKHRETMRLFLLEV